MGTSLVVYPVAGLVDQVKSHIPRLLINLEPVGKGVLQYHRKAMNKRLVFVESTLKILKKHSVQHLNI